MWVRFMGGKVGNKEAKGLREAKVLNVKLPRMIISTIVGRKW